MKLEIESRHSDYGPDAGGYRVLRLDGKYIGRVEDYALGEKLVKAVDDLTVERDTLKNPTRRERTLKEAERVFAAKYQEAVAAGWLTRDARVVAPAKQYEFLNHDFLALMNDIGRLGHEKFGADTIEVAGGGRKIERHQKDAIIYHARGHLTNYLLGVKHDELGTTRAHLAAAAFNAMLEYYFSQGE